MSVGTNNSQKIGDKARTSYENYKSHDHCGELRKKFVDILNANLKEGGNFYSDIMKSSAEGKKNVYYQIRATLPPYHKESCQDTIVKFRKHDCMDIKLLNKSLIDVINNNNIDARVTKFDNETFNMEFSW